MEPDLGPERGRIEGAVGFEREAAEEPAPEVFAVRLPPPHPEDRNPRRRSVVSEPPVPIRLKSPHRLREVFIR
jgi:hypothetical protein